MSLLGIDIGTTMCKAAAFDADGCCLASASREYPTLHPRPEWAELDSRDVWDKTKQVIAEVASSTRKNPITALSVSSLGEALVPLSKDRRILGRSIRSTDMRGVEYAEALEKHFGRQAFYRINANLIGPHFSLPKLLWLRDHEPRYFRSIDLFLPWGDAIGFLLGGDAVTVNSLASRTLLFDLFHNDWSEEILAWSGMDRQKFAPIASAGMPLGTVSDAIAAEIGLPRGVIIVTGGHDQCCNALGCGCIQTGQAVCGIGTYECITPVFGPVTEPLSMFDENLNMEHHVLPDLYVAFLYNHAGSLVKWFRDTFAMAEMRAGGDVYGLLNAEIPADPTRILVLPHFDPPQWPRFIPDTTGAILGLKSSATRGEILKGIFESISLYFVPALDALIRMGINLTEIVASGGGAKSDAWLQIKADIFGIPVIRLRTIEGGLAGTAMLAGMATRLFHSAKEAAEHFVHKETVFEPDTVRHAFYREKNALFQRVYPSLRDLLKDLKSPSSQMQNRP